MDLLIHSVVIFTNDDDNQVLYDQGLVIQGSQIQEIGPLDILQEKYPDYPRFDGQSRLLMPGLVNAHMHFYGTYARGLALATAPQNFYEILSLLWWKLDSALDLNAVYYSALVPALTAIRRGVTSVIDHHASPQAVDGSLDAIEKALGLVGMRGLLCYEVSDRDGKEISAQGLEENARYIKKCKAARRENPHHLWDGMIGLHASFTVDDDTLELTQDLKQSLQRGVHIHVLEDLVDRTKTQEKYSSGVVERLVKYGLMGKDSIAAHGIYLTPEEIEFLVESETIVVHQPQSNMNNAVGRADVFGLLEKGLTVGIGTDGMSADLRPDIRTAFLLHKHDLKDSNVGWEEIQKMALKNNPTIYRQLTGQKVGVIEPGYLADLILVDYFPPTPMNGDNFWGHFLFGIVDAPVDTTIINGQIVMEGRQISHLDEREIAAKSRECAEKVWKRFAE